MHLPCRVAEGTGLFRERKTPCITTITAFQRNPATNPPVFPYRTTLEHPARTDHSGHLFHRIFPHTDNRKKTLRQTDRHPLYRNLPAETNHRKKGVKTARICERTKKKMRKDGPCGKKTVLPDRFRNRSRTVWCVPEPENRISSGSRWRLHHNWHDGC